MPEVTRIAYKQVSHHVPAFAYVLERILPRGERSERGQNAKGEEKGYIHWDFVITEPI